MTMKVYDLTDVSVHNNMTDCWIIINARVYDVTKFLSNHPGGDSVLLDVAGKNASEEFEEAGHGSAARLMLDEYYIGEVDLLTYFSDSSSTKSPKAENHSKQQEIIEENMRSQSGFAMKSVGILLPLAILGGIVGFIFYK